MNDTEIKEQYPKAWDKFLDFSGLRKSWHPFDDPKWFRQYLYDFFDELEIAVEIGLDFTLEAKYCYRVLYMEDHEWVETDDSGIGDWSDLYLRRHQAEAAAFTDAFAVLEKQLT